MGSDWFVDTTVGNKTDAPTNAGVEPEPARRRFLLRARSRTTDQPTTDEAADRATDQASDGYRIDDRYQTDDGYRVDNSAESAESGTDRSGSFADDRADDRYVADRADGDSDEDGRVVDEAPGRVGWAHTSTLAIVGLILAITSVYAGLTAVLSPIALAAGFIGVFISAIGLNATRKLNVTGRGVAVFALLLSLVGIALGAAAVSGSLPWLDHADQAGRLRDWLDAHVPGL